MSAELASTFREAMRLWDALKADGVPMLTRVQTLEQTLRQAWPFTREWKYLCPKCDDLGLVLATCDGTEQCGRMKPHLAHEFGTPCWCRAGARFKPKPKSAEDFTEAGKSRAMTRAGR